MATIICEKRGRKRGPNARPERHVDWERRTRKEEGQPKAPRKAEDAKKKRRKEGSNVPASASAAEHATTNTQGPEAAKLADEGGTKAAARAAVSADAVTAAASAAAFSALENEWEGYIKAAEVASDAKDRSAHERTMARIAVLDKEILRASGKLWEWRRMQDLCKERDVQRMALLKGTRARQRYNVDATLAPYRDVLKSSSSAGALLHAPRVAMRNKPELAAAASLKAEESATANATATASSSSSSAPTRTRAEVLLMTPANATRALTLHLQHTLGACPPPLLLTVGDVCDECGVQMRVIANDSMLGCPTCHKTRLLPNTTTVAVSHSGDVDYSASISHTKHRLPEWIEMAQGKQYAEPPQAVLEVVVEHLVKTRTTGLEPFAAVIAEERAKRGPFRDAVDAETRLASAIPNLRDLLQQVQAGTVRRALRLLVQSGASEKLRKFYEHSTKCASYISGYWPPRLNAQQEEVLRLLYAAAAPAYEARRKPTQHYWPGGFPYFLRSVCALKAWDEFVPLFPLPAGSRDGGGRHTLRKLIWEQDLQWEVVPAHAPLPPIQVRVAGTDTYEHFQLLKDDGDDDGGEDECHEAVEENCAPNKRARFVSME